MNTYGLASKALKVNYLTAGSITMASTILLDLTFD
jgi:hypothetical protein